MRSHELCLVSRQELNNYRYSGTCSEVYMASRIYPDWWNESTFVRFRVFTRVTTWGFKCYGMWYRDVRWIVNEVLKNCGAFIFRVKTLTLHIKSAWSIRVSTDTHPTRDPSPCQQTLTPHMFHHSINGHSPHTWSITVSTGTHPTHDPSQYQRTLTPHMIHHLVNGHSTHTWSITVSTDTHPTRDPSTCQWTLNPRMIHHSVNGHSPHTTVLQLCS